MPQPSRQIPALEFLDVTAGYREGSPVLHNTSLALTGPGLFHLAGRNGTGKSTFTELASGYLRPWQGQVMVAGVPADDPASRSTRRICRSDVALFGHMTVRDHLAFTCMARSESLDDLLPRAERLGLEPYLDLNAGMLSTGNARKLWYLVCTTGAFTLAILDEPFNGVDQESSDAMCDELSCIAASGTVVLVAHTLPEALTVSRTLRMEELSGVNILGSLQ